MSKQTSVAKVLECFCYIARSYIDNFLNILFYHVCEPLHFFPLVPEEKYLTLEGFHKFAIDRAKQDIRSLWRAILACGYDLHFER